MKLFIFKRKVIEIILFGYVGGYTQFIRPDSSVKVLNKLIAGKTLGNLFILNAINDLTSTLKFSMN